MAGRPRGPEDEGEAGSPGSQLMPTCRPSDARGCHRWKPAKRAGPERTRTRNAATHAVCTTRSSRRSEDGTPHAFQAQSHTWFSSKQAIATACIAHRSAAWAARATGRVRQARSWAWRPSELASWGSKSVGAATMPGDRRRDRDGLRLTAGGHQPSRRRRFVRLHEAPADRVGGAADLCLDARRGAGEAGGRGSAPPIPVVPADRSQRPASLFEQGCAGAQRPVLTEITPSGSALSCRQPRSAPAGPVITSADGSRADLRPWRYSLRPVRDAREPVPTSDGQTGTGSRLGAPVTEEGARGSVGSEFTGLVRSAAPVVLLAGGWRGRGALTH